MTRIEVHLDFVSPYAYLAWPRLRAIAKARRLELVGVPTLFAGLLGATGALGPAEIPAKRAWLVRDVLRRAGIEGIPLVGPPEHPFNPLVALRAASAVIGHARLAAIDVLFDAAWARGEDISTEEGVAQALTRAGLGGDAIVLRARDGEVKQALRDATDAAIARGVFGVPTIFVGEAMFFGQDRLGDLELHLDGKAPVDEAHVATMLARPSGAARRR